MEKVLKHFIINSKIRKYYKWAAPKVIDMTLDQAEFNQFEFMVRFFDCKTEKEARDLFEKSLPKLRRISDALLRYRDYIAARDKALGYVSKDRSCSGPGCKVY